MNTASAFSIMAFSSLGLICDVGCSGNPDGGSPEIGGSNAGGSAATGGFAATGGTSSTGGSSTNGGNASTGGGSPVLGSTFPCGGNTCVVGQSYCYVFIPTTPGGGPVADFCDPLPQACDNSIDCGCVTQTVACACTASSGAIKVTCYGP